MGIKKIKKIIRKNKELAVILAAALMSRLYFLFYYNGLLWDSSVYAGMGKFIFSLGKAGLWEHIRPVLLPFFLGIFWKLNLDAIFFGQILEILLIDKPESLLAS